MRHRRISGKKLAATARNGLAARGKKFRPAKKPEPKTSRKKRYGDSLKTGFVRGIYESTKTGRREEFESSYELRRFKALDESPLVKDWGRPKVVIPYKLGKRKKRYHPDILVQYHDGRIFLEEVKGHVFHKKMFIQKNHMATWFCKVKGWTYRIIYEKDIENLF